MKKWIIIILIMAAITINFQSASADDNNILAFKKSIEEHRTRSSAVGISVNSNEEIALGFSDGYINVYDSNGKLINGYSFNAIGSYVFRYDEIDNIMILPIRAGRCYFFNTDAKLVKTREIYDTNELDRYYRSLQGNRKVRINGNLYELRDTLGYTKLTKTDANGNRTIIYDIGWDFAGIVVKGVFGLFFIIVLFVYLKNLIK